jgi:hypothetical protein
VDLIATANEIEYFQVAPHACYLLNVRLVEYSTRNTRIHALLAS